MRIFIVPLMLLQVSATVGCCSLNGFGFNHDRQYTGRAGASEQAQAYAHYLSAIVKERQGQFDDAIIDMERAAECDPKAGTPTLRLVRAYVQRQDYPNAVRFCERMVEITPDNPRMWILLGEMYRQVDRDEDAQRALDKAIEIAPDSLEGYGALADLLEDMNDLVATTDVYKRLTELSPESAVFQYEYGVNLARMQDLPTARAALERALELKPDFVRARYVLALVCLDSNDVESGIAHLRAYLERRDGDRQAREQLAFALVRAGGYDEGIQVLGEIVDGPRAEPKHYLALMLTHIRAGQPREAERRQPPEEAPFLSTFLRAIARRDQNEPVAPLLESLDKIEGDLDAECTDYLGDIMLRLGKDSMGDYLLEAVTGFENMGVRSRTLGVIHARMLMALERPEQALDVLRVVERDFGADKFLHYYYALTFEELDRLEETELHLKEYLKIEPDAADVLNFLGYFYAEHNQKLDEAEALVRKALEQEPESPFYLDSLGWVMYRRGKADEALALIRQALSRMEGDDAVLRDHLGDVYLLKGDTARAIVEWSKAHRLDPNLEGVREKIEQHGGAGVAP